MYKENGYIKDGEWYTCHFNRLNKECKDLVNDLVNSSHVSHRWSDELKHQYFTKAVFMAFDEGRKRHENKWEKMFIRIRDKVFVFLFRLIGYIP